MALKTTLEQLEETQTAISAVCLGQSATIDGVQLTRANLKDLEAREEKLLIRYRNEQNTGGMTLVQGIPRRDY
jgi:hypothetical protein